MTFRIKPNNDSEQWDKQQKAYHQHLSQFNKRENNALWKYFYHDFYHDGEIKKITLWDNPQEVVLSVSCPNIERKTANATEYINVDFECIFSDVVNFNFDHNDPEELRFNQHCSFQFMSSEINTLTEIIEKKSTNDIDLNSLIIEVLGNDTSFFIEMVFSQVNVVAVDNTAYELMLASDDFIVPIYKIS